MVISVDSSTSVSVPLTMAALGVPATVVVSLKRKKPNTALDPFLRYMLREVAAGTGCSYESLSRDYSNVNYSSGRLGSLDDRDLWKVLQAWFARSYRAPLHAQWLSAAVLSRAVSSIAIDSYALDPERFEAVTWKFRGWSWVDPTKEVKAYAQAVREGFTTVTAVIAATAGGADIEDVIAERKRELELFDEAGILLDSTVAKETPAPDAAALAADKATAAAADAAEADPADDPQTNPAPAAKAARVLPIRGTA